MARKHEGKGLRPGVVRGICIGVLFGLAVVSAVFHTGTGTLSSFGIGAVAYLCPLGALEALLGTWSFVPRALIALAAVLILALLVGRAFCAWACPVPPLRSFLSSKKTKQRDAEETALAARESAGHYEQGTDPARKGKANLDSRHIVLCGVLGSAAVFGFPVFCLICPIGLTFAIVVGLVRLIGYNEPSVSLLIFAAVLLVELVFLRKWCAKFCPVGALLSLVGRAGKTFLPRADASKCLRTTQGQLCGACAAACPERIDPQADKGPVPVSECTRCAKCSEACPAAAISFPFLARAAGGAAVAEAAADAVGEAASDGGNRD